MAARSEADLERQAMEEILRESKRGAERAKESGAYGWEKPRLHPTNKVFLRNTVLSTLPSRRRVQAPSRKSSSKESSSTTRKTESEHRKRERRDSPSRVQADKKRHDEDVRSVSKAESARTK